MGATAGAGEGAASTANQGAAVKYQQLQQAENDDTNDAPTTFAHVYYNDTSKFPFVIS